MHSTLDYLFISRFGFKSGICLLIAPVPVLCFSITFGSISRKMYQLSNRKINNIHGGLGALGLRSQHHLKM